MGDRNGDTYIQATQKPQPPRRGRETDAGNWYLTEQVDRDFHLKMPSMMRAVGVSKMTRELDAMTNCSFAFVPHRFLIAAARFFATSRHGILMLDVNPNSCSVIFFPD